MRTRILIMTALTALGLLAPVTTASADVCLTVDVIVNGDAVVAEDHCVPL